MITKDNAGHASSMRVGFLLTLTIGSVMILSGITAVFLQIPEGVTMINAGAVMMTGSGFAKAVQKKYEQ